MEKASPGYGYTECKNCQIITDPIMAAFCSAMVEWSRMQEEAARRGDLDFACLCEDRQNQIALGPLALNGQCAPGANRV